MKVNVISLYISIILISSYSCSRKVNSEQNIITEIENYLFSLDNELHEIKLLDSMYVHTINSKLYRIKECDDCEQFVIIKHLTSGDFFYTFPFDDNFHYPQSEQEFNYFTSTRDPFVYEFSLSGLEILLNLKYQTKDINKEFLNAMDSIVEFSYLNSYKFFNVIRIKDLQAFEKEIEIMETENRSWKDSTFVFNEMMTALEYFHELMVKKNILIYRISKERFFLIEFGKNHSVFMIRKLDAILVPKIKVMN